MCDADDPPLRFTTDARLQSKLRSAEETLQLTDDDLPLSSVAEHVTALCASMAQYVEALAHYALKYLEHFRCVRLCSRSTRSLSLVLTLTLTRVC